MRLAPFTVRSSWESLQESLRKQTCRSLTWLGPRVCRHEYVIEHIMSQAPVLPARFATLFSSLDSLEQFLVEHRVAIAGFFTELGEKQEWAVKGLLGSSPARCVVCFIRGGRIGWLSWHSLLSGSADQGPVGARVQPTAKSVQSARGSGPSDSHRRLQGTQGTDADGRGKPSPRSS